MHPALRAAVWALQDCGYNFLDAVRAAKARKTEIVAAYNARAAELAANATTVEAWNRVHPIGTQVDVRLDGGGTIRTRTRSRAQLLGGPKGHPVVWVEGIASCYAISHVTPVEP